MKKTKTKTKTKIYAFAAGFSILCALCWPPKQAEAAAVAGDDFGNIVNNIEAEYHVHRNYRFLMAFAGFTVKCFHFAGVKGFKAALFENQHLFAAQPDTRLDEIVQAAGKSGWQPLIKSYSRRNEEHNYIYVQGESKELKLLIVSVEPNEAFVAQVKIDANKLSDFINENGGQRPHRGHWETQ